MQEDELTLKIEDSTKAEYYKRVYESIDGLWFLMVEADKDFDHALEIDRRVWQIVPKIQARKIRELLDIEGRGAEALAQALEAKFLMDGANAEISIENKSLTISIKTCPWYALMKGSGREPLAEKVGTVICGTEYPVWQKEFGVEGDFVIDELQCGGAPVCRMRFDLHEL